MGAMVRIFSRGEKWNVRLNLENGMFDSTGMFD